MGQGAVAVRSMRYDVSHRTTYRYQQPVAQSYHLMHLEPRPHPRQQVLSQSVLIEPAPIMRRRITDAFGNPAEVLRIEDRHRELSVHARMSVVIAPTAQIDLDQSSAWDTIAGRMTTADGLRALDVVEATIPSRHTPPSSAILSFAAPSFPPGRSVLAGAMDLTRRIHAEFRFDPSATDVSTPVDAVLRSKRGVCQDFAHLSLAALRALSLPARYVSGYLLTRPPPGRVKLRGADASHAWIAVWSPETGWVDFDPTNGVVPVDEHITLATGRDYDDVCPISGVLLGGGEQSMTVAVDVDPVR